jgi:hypothetical protein
MKTLFAVVVAACLISSFAYPSRPLRTPISALIGRELGSGLL